MTAETSNDHGHDQRDDTDQARRSDGRALPVPLRGIAWSESLVSYVHRLRQPG